MTFRNKHTPKSAVCVGIGLGTTQNEHSCVTTNYIA